MCATRHTIAMADDYPLAETPAARMLSEGLARAKDERGLSMRQIGKQMNYKTSVVLSHMASGRVPIPIDRTMEMAELLELDKRTFLLAVIRQRHPDIPWHLLSEADTSLGSDSLALELQAALGAPLEQLNREQRAVMREVAAEHAPRKRWLSVHELHAVEVLREAFPKMQKDGISSTEAEKIRVAGENR